MIKKALLPPSKHKVLKQIFTLRTGSLLVSLSRICGEYYEEKQIHSTESYIYVEGTTPVMLVAHLDTVHPTPPALWIHDNEQNVIWSPEGLGADDRAGVFSILEILQAGYRPYLLFTTGEETGGTGARAFVSDFPKSPADLMYIVELDRQGYNDAVYYGCGNEAFATFIETFGFETSWGTFSDISVIAPVWDRAAVNLSIGYFNEHTHAEFLNYSYMFETIRKVEKILENCGDQIYRYEPWRSSNIYNDDYWFDIEPRAINGKVQCDGCNAMIPENKIIKVKDHFESAIWRLCPTCLKLNEGIVDVI